MPKTSDELRSKVIGARATEAEYAAMQLAAKEDDGMSMSAKAIKILVAWLIEHGNLAPKEPAE